jgi:hypothetical protein
MFVLWVVAKEICPAGCQSWVATTLSNFCDIIINDGDNLVAFGDGQCAAWTKIVLYIRNGQTITFFAM